MDGIVCRLYSRIKDQRRVSQLARLQFRYENISRRFSSSTNDCEKKQVVVLGTGWSSLYFVKNLDLTKYDLKVVSPRNYFTFTPLLSKLSAGKISSVTCTEPFASFMHRHKKGNFQFVHARCLDVDPSARTVECVSDTLPNEKIELPYDYLVVAVGAESNTFGIPGVERHALFLKEVEHAERIYEKIISNFEAAAIPGVADEDKRRLLHMVVVGGGPTGVELTAEIALLFNNYIGKAFPKLAPYAKITIIEGGSRVLATFTPENSKFVADVLKAKNVNIVLGKQVCSVGKEECTVKDASTGQTETFKCGIVVWASGLKPSELVSKIQKRFKQQNNPRALVVDQYLALRGNADRNIFVMGDCCKVVPDRLTDHLNDVMERIGSMDHNSLIRRSKELSKTFPQLSQHKFNPKDEVFKDFCKNLIRKEKEPKTVLLEVMKYIDDNYASPFPTAQNAKQEGLYLSRSFNVGLQRERCDAFTEVWKGSLASIGGTKVVGRFPYFQLNGGLTAFLMWLSVYMVMFSSNKMRLCYICDSIIQKMCGRHIISRQPGKSTKV
ncbi:putative NADH dehydrogenase [Babesia divergens]|uniref:NADH:ubiquinone reductase (non-electrogenic) n=1 Tax=Babesia divergens TaxID=32595 RepID=A0AAD9LHW0_BABDI|nr:putative NADH dehydrogenase [Babesia divergens]